MYFVFTEAKKCPDLSCFHWGRETSITCAQKSFLFVENFPQNEKYSRKGKCVSNLLLLTLKTFTFTRVKLLFWI